ncbi:hypothetical protein [Radiobacillus sp. PE A8.2]|uniref:TolB family protein n=1 Tax=Radiobacillus sp. PE A8.2 TaxID=3380349 RepID=UPI00388EB3BF
MRKTIIAVVLVLCCCPISSVVSKAELVKAVFMRDNNVWLLHQGKEKQITNSGSVFSTPSWSHDGQWLLYQQEAQAEFQEVGMQLELWAYHVDTGKKQKIFYHAFSPLWSSKENLIAFNAQGILNISNLNSFNNVATGVNSYTWLPDATGFLLSSSAVLRPDGWTSPILFTKNINFDHDDLVFNGVEKMFTIPKEIELGNQKINSINASSFEFSPSNQWISFIVSPTASLSMDSNVLCVISKHGDDFHVLDEVIFGVGEPKWAPNSDTIAFIAGGGRIVFGFKDKQIKVKEMPTTGTYTPENYAELDFDWVSDFSLVTARIEEQEWSNDFSKHPYPALYLIDLNKNTQTKITNPPTGYGDYNPQYSRSLEKLVWLRGTSITIKIRNYGKLILMEQKPYPGLKM